MKYYETTILLFVDSECRPS